MLILNNHAFLFMHGTLEYKLRSEMTIFPMFSIAFDCVDWFRGFNS